MNKLLFSVKGPIPTEFQLFECVETRGDRSWYRASTRLSYEEFLSSAAAFTRNKQEPVYYTTFVTDFGGRGANYPFDAKTIMQMITS